MAALAVGISPNQSHPHALFDQRLIHESAAGGYADTAAAVIACGADKDARGRLGNTPLSYSSRLPGRRQTSLVMLAAGARTDLPNNESLDQEHSARAAANGELADLVRKVRIIRQARSGIITAPSSTPGTAARPTLLQDAPLPGRLAEYVGRGPSRRTFPGDGIRVRFARRCRALQARPRGPPPRAARSLRGRSTSRRRDVPRQQDHPRRRVVRARGGMV